MLTMFLHLVLFLIIFIAVFYPFGYYLVSKSRQELNPFEIVLLSLVSSLVLFVMMAMLLGVLKIRFLSLPIVVGVNIWAIIKSGKKLLAPLKGLLTDKVFWIIAGITLFIQGFINYPSGFKYPEGLLFWSSQGHDGLWHVSLIEEMKKSLPLLNPIYSGEQLVNYHYLVDVIMGEFGRIFPFFNSLDLYFRFFTVVFSFLMSLSVFSFVSAWQGNKKIGYWAMFFTTLTGSFGYLITLVKNGKLFAGETIFWAAQGNTIVGNPPHAFSFTLIPTALLAFYYFLKTQKKYWFWVTLLISSIMAGFKVSGGFVFLVGFGAAGIIFLLAKKGWKVLVLVALAGVTNFVTVKLLTRGVESFLLFVPWWFIRTMIVVPERLGVVILEHRRQYYLSLGTFKAILRVIQLELGGFFIFVIGNLGSRIIGVGVMFNKVIWNFKKLIINPLEVMLLVSMLTGLVVPLLFVQKGIIYNNIAFMQYFILIFGFFSAITVYKLLVRIKNIPLKAIVATLIIVLSLPTVIGNLVEFYGRPSLAKVSNAELEALSYLKTNSDSSSVILNLPFDKYIGGKLGNQPWPIGGWYSTGYIPALAARQTYLSSEEQAMITGYDIESRLINMRKFFLETDLVWNQSFLKDNDIQYIYLTKFQKDKMDKPGDYLKIFFENSEVVVYEVI